MPEPVRPLVWGIALGLALFTTAGCERKSTVRVVRTDTLPGGLNDPSRKAQAGEKVQLLDHAEELKLPPALGNTYYVRPDRGAAKWQGLDFEPLEELSSALEQLGPGDRLILLPGEYLGPIEIGDRCRDGTPERPIEVWGRVDAVLGVASAEPVLTIRRAHWRFYGLEISPGSNGTWALATRGARDVLFTKGHLHDGMASGVLIGPGSENVRIEDTHIHIFGRVDRGQAFEGGAAGATAGVGLAIAPGSRDIRIARSNIHNIYGLPLVVLEPNQYEMAASGAPYPPTVGVVLDDNKLQENWETGQPK